MFELTSLQLALAAAAALCIGFAKGGFGGAGMLAVLLMAQVYPARESTGAILPMLIVGDIIAVWVFHAHSRAAIVLRLLPPAFIGILCGWVLMPRIEPMTFARLMGCLTLALLVLVVLQKFLPKLVLKAEQRRYGWPLGWMAGVTTMLANAAGPVTTIYLLACRLPKMEFVGTAAWFFLVVNVVKIPFSASLGLISRESLLLNLFLAPLIIGGVFVARYFLKRINQSAFEWIMIVLSALGALRLAFS
ncbi:MAG: sulfite exporter TauE/SafE family protein [Terrimicrobiaceae bacterium]